jgi:NAD(P)-dependent dehydrogenase (short-subunit alcohol dehydrogenase family)
MPELDGKVAIVTGAGSRGPGTGNGKAIAVLFARAGAKVTVVDRSRERAEETEQLLIEEGQTPLVMEADVSQPAACAKIVEETVSHFGRLDVLVNGVGIEGPPGNAVEVDPDQWDLAMNVNVKSMMLMAKHAVPEMVKAEGGSIVNLSSAAGLNAGLPSLLYPTSKAAVNMLTKAMADHHGPDNIRVNCISPGLVYTPMVVEMGLTPENRERRRLASMLKTEGTAWDIASAALYLASDAARWVTAVILPVDAGLTALSPALGPVNAVPSEA